jgi:hypothetical protein
MTESRHAFITPKRRKLGHSRTPWRDPRILRLTALVDAINREIEALEWLDATYVRAAARERVEQAQRDQRRFVWAS